MARASWLRRSTYDRGARARAALWAVALVAGCLPGPRYRVPATPTPLAVAYKEAHAGPWKLARPADAIPRGRWWIMFGEPELDRLQARLAIDNQTIAAAVQNYLAARALVRGARASYFPTVTAAPSVTWTRSPGLSSGLTPGVSSGAVGGAAGTSAVAGRHLILALPAEASWAPDLFGRVRNTVRWRQYAAQVSAADLESARLLAQASLAQTFFLLRGQDALQELLDATVKSNQAIVELTRTRYDEGLDSEVNVVLAELTLQSSVVQATNAGILRAQYEHAIATLIGIPATDFSLPVRAALPPPPPIPLGAPSQLLERRPDIAAAERQMASANAVIGIGYSAYFPVITLSAVGGVASKTLGSLLAWPSRLWSLGANLSQLIFDGGARRATIDQAIAAYNASVASYRQTVLTAFQQVEDALVAVRILAEAIEQQQRAVALAQDAYELEKARYQNGLDPYVDLMLQQVALLSAQQQLVSLRTQHLTAAVALVVALGGGWDRAQLPTVRDVSGAPTPAQRRIVR